MGKGRSTAKAALQLAPIIVYMASAYALMTLGLYALIEDSSIVNDACGKTYHVWKFSFLNMALWFFATTTYCHSSPWKGGEGARARALVLMIFYLAFCVWGVLMWWGLTDQCTHVMKEQYHVLCLYLQASMWMNGITGLMFVAHETFLGQWMQADLTLMADVYHKYNAPLNQPHIQENGGPMPSTITGPDPSHMQSQTPPPSLSPGDLSPANAYEYDKIMQNKTTSGSSTSLPGVEP